MQRYFTDERLIEGETFISGGADTHHMKNVMRFKPSQQFHMVDAAKKAFLCEVTGVDEVIHYKAVYELDEDPELPVETTVFCPLLKGEKFDWMIQKATELGAHHFKIFDADRSIVKLDHKKRTKRLQRYQKIIREAAEQSRRNSLPDIDFSTSLKKSDFSGFSTVLFAYEANVGHPAASMDKVLGNLSENQKIALVFGPEGGFTESEVQVMEDYHSIRLGARILRAETAPLYALSALSYHFEQPASN